MSGIKYKRFIIFTKCKKFNKQYYKMIKTENKFKFEGLDVTVTSIKGLRCMPKQENIEKPKITCFIADMFSEK